MKKMIILFAIILMAAVGGGTCQASPSSDSMFATDKVAHFGVGYLINDQLKRHTKLTPLERTLVVVGVGYLKEKHDSHEPGNRFDKRDLAATVLGGLVSQLTWTIKF